MPYCLHSEVVYKCSCGRCNAAYYGETWRHLSVRVGKHSGASSLSTKRSESRKSKSMAVKERMPFCDHIVSIEDLKNLATSDSDFYDKVK